MTVLETLQYRYSHLVALLVDHLVVDAPGKVKHATMER